MQAIQRKFKKATSTRRGKIIALSILFVIVAGVAGGLFWWQTHKKQLIREKLESAIHEKSEGLYNVKYDALDLDEVSGYLSIKNVSLSYDSLKYRTLLDQDRAPSILLNIHIPEITITGVQTPRALLEKEIKGDKLELRNPTIEIIYTMHGKDSARNVPARDIYEQILGGLKQISIDTIALLSANITTRNLKTKQKGIELVHTTLQLINVKVDSAAQEDPSRLFFAKQVSAAAESITWKADDRPYRYEIKNISMSSGSQIVYVNSFDITPLLGEDAFVKSLPAQDDRFDFTFKNIRIKKLDFYKAMEENIVADTIIIESSSFKIYRDLNIPRDKKNRVGTYPSQILLKLPIPVEVDRLVLKNADIEYKEKNNITKNAGKVQFHGVYATITNLTNKKERIAKDNTMNIDINTRFLNKTPFKASWVFYLGSPNGRFDIKGNLGSINVRDLNPLTEPMGPARLEKGTINNLTFDLKGNDYSMTGTIKLLYEDLKIALLEKDKGSKEWDKKSLTSFVANIFVKNSNPRDKDEEPIVKTVTLERDTNRSIYYLTWKTIFKGARETLGIKK
jgi:hypothetical protein